MSKKFTRNFLIFQEEDKGFEISPENQPSGYTKIESRNGKCKISVFAQNLKSDRGPYFCYLVDSTKNPAIVARLGEVSINEGGSGERTFEEDEKNIFDTGLSADDFNVAAIVKEGNRIQAPLVGYLLKDKTTWKEKITSESFRKRIEEEESFNGNASDSSENPPVKSEDFKYDMQDVEFSGETNIGNTTSNYAPVANDSLDVSINNRENLTETIEDQVKRKDSDYVEEYSYEGMKFKHYEEEINFLNADLGYANKMAEEREPSSVPYVNTLEDSSLPSMKDSDGRNSFGNMASGEESFFNSDAVYASQMVDERNSNGKAYAYNMDVYGNSSSVSSNSDELQSAKETLNPIYPSNSGANLDEEIIEDGRELQAALNSSSSVEVPCMMQVESSYERDGILLRALRKLHIDGELFERNMGVNIDLVEGEILNQVKRFINESITNEIEYRVDDSSSKKKTSKKKKKKSKK